MRYQGSKGRHAKQLVPIIMSGHDPSKPYIEPFVGGGNMIKHVTAPIRLGYDVDEDVIALLRGLSEGWLPPETLSEEQYKDIKENGHTDKCLVGFAKFCCSFGGKAWGGFARDKKGVDQIHHPQSRTLRKEAPLLKGCYFGNLIYLYVAYPDGSTVYCDPPYADTTGYKSGKFDHDEFWKFMDDLSSRCRVFVSEYTAPEGWECVWEKKVSGNLSIDTGGKKSVERLFTKEKVWMI